MDLNLGRYNIIKATWESCKKSCVNPIPSVYYATNGNNNIYYVAKDFSTIVFLVYFYDNKSYTYTIPKKYLILEYYNDDTKKWNIEKGKGEIKRYFFTKSNKLSIVSCSNSQVDEFDLFVVKNIINKI